MKIMHTLYDYMRWVLLLSAFILISCGGGSNSNTAAPTTKAITSFALPSPNGLVDGVIVGDTISVTVPYGTEVKSLAATFETSAASVHVNGESQVSGKSTLDFSKPIDYVVTDSQGGEKTYTVNVSVAKISDNHITAFSLNENIGHISGDTISVTVPYGTDVSKLTPKFVSDGASVVVNKVRQMNGRTLSMSFAKPVNYIVTAADGAQRTYSVEVGVAAQSNLQITSFSLDGYSGVIDQNASTITVYVPYGTTVTNLVATYDTTASAVYVNSFLQQSGVTPNNFTSPIIYRLVGVDGSVREYTATVQVSAKSSKDILKFVLGGNPGIITANNVISVTLPYGTNRTSLIANFITNGVAVKVGSTTQVSGVTPNDFTSNSVTYTVYAEDGSTKTYNVVTNTAANTSADILSYSIRDAGGTVYNGVITTNTIDVLVPTGTNVESSVATFAISGIGVKVGNVEQVSGTTPNNFTNPVRYTVTAASGARKVYTVKVTVAPSSAKDFTVYSLNGYQGIIGANSISVVVGYDTNIAALTASFTQTGIFTTINGKTQQSGATLNDFTAPVNYVVHAEDGSTKTYTVTVTQSLNSSKDLTQFKILGIPGQIIGTNITVDVPYDADVSDAAAEFITTGTSVQVAGVVQISGVTRQNFSQPVQYVVTATDTTTKTYTVTVNKLPSSANDITQFSLSGTPGRIVGTNIFVTLPYGSSLGNIAACYTTTGQAVFVNSSLQQSCLTPNDFYAPVDYSVVAANADVKTYRVISNIAKIYDKDITSFSINGAIGIIDGDMILVSLPQTTDFTALVPNFTTSGVEVLVGGTPQTSGSTANDFSELFLEYQVRAYNNTMKTYEVYIDTY